MGELTIQKLGDELIIRFPEKALDAALVDRIYRLLRMEYLARKAEFDAEELEKLAEEITTDWWVQHGATFLKDVKK